MTPYHNATSYYLPFLPGGGHTIPASAAAAIQHMMTSAAAASVHPQNASAVAAISPLSASSTSSSPMTPTPLSSPNLPVAALMRRSDGSSDNDNDESSHLAFGVGNKGPITSTRSKRARISPANGKRPSQAPASTGMSSISTDESASLGAIASTDSGSVRKRATPTNKRKLPSEQSAALRRKKHKEVEVRRRKKISGLFQALSEILDTGPTDKASILAAALEALTVLKAEQKCRDAATQPTSPSTTPKDTRPTTDALHSTPRTRYTNNNNDNDNGNEKSNDDKESDDDDIDTTVAHTPAPPAAPAPAPAPAPSPSSMFNGEAHYHDRVSLKIEDGQRNNGMNALSALTHPYQQQVNAAIANYQQQMATAAATASAIAANMAHMGLGNNMMMMHPFMAAAAAAQQQQQQQQSVSNYGMFGHNLHGSLPLSHLTTVTPSTSLSSPLSSFLNGMMNANVTTVRPPVALPLGQCNNHSNVLSATLPIVPCVKIERLASPSSPSSTSVPGASTTLSADDKQAIPALVSH